MMKRSELFFTAILVPLDLLMIGLAFIGAYFFRLHGGVTFVWPLDQYLTFVGSIAPFWLPIFALAGMYSLKKTWRPWEEFAAGFVGVSGGTFLVIAWPFLTRQEFFSRLIVIYLFIFALIFVTFGRILLRSFRRWLFRYGIGVHRLIIIGSNEIAARFVKDIEENRWLGMRVIGLLQSREDGQIEPALNHLPVLGLAKDFAEIINGQKIDDILIADPTLAKSTVLDILELAEDRGINFKLSPSLLDVHSMNIQVSELGGIPILEYRRTALEGWGMILKRVVDIVGSTILIILTSPIMLLTALAIKLDSPGPVFFNTLPEGEPTTRVGQFGRPFYYFKFRSMVPDAHWQRYTVLKKLDTRHGPLVKIKDDPRVTRVGRFIRKYSLDELPELFLVLIGRMSLVGPRPHLPEEVAKYQTHHRQVLLVKPGITGMAQVSGRSDLDFDDEVRIDTYYLENWSLWLDLQIMLKTPLAVLGHRARKAGD